MPAASTLQTLDIATILAYFVAVMGIGFWASRRVKTQKDYFLGDRQFGKSLLVMHWLCTGTHTEHAVQVSGATARVGLGGDLVSVDAPLFDPLLLADCSHSSTTPGHHDR